MVRFIAMGAIFLAGVAGLSAAPSPGAAVDFSRDIQPILSDNCYHCHGPDEKGRKGKLRLDTQAGAFRIKDGKTVILPGKSAQRELVRRITTRDADDVMPPPDSNRQLTARQVELLKRWVDQGAKWGQHWALVAPQRPELPKVKNKSWPRNAVDYFILARLEREGLKPSAEAAKEKLIRRVTLDLTGLPPTLEEVDAFRADTSKKAYEKLVDRLLRSPRYGERMVWEWLDAARYADTNGYQGDGTRTMWPWRDWAIEALNNNLPFNQFTVEQLAGDLLPGATVQQKLASGFNRNHMLNGEGGRIAEESRVEYVVDRVNTTSTVWLGVTMGCAQCHDHKFDPFTQKEFYQLSAYFNNVNESGAVDRGGNANPVVSLPTAEQTAKIAALSKALAELNEQLKANAELLRAKQAEWEGMVGTHAAKGTNAIKVPTNIVVVLQVPAEKRTAAQNKELTEHYFSTVPERQALQKKLDETRKSLEGLNNSIVVAMVMEERKDPRETFILVRGAYDKYGDKVSAGLPASLAGATAGAATNRLALAKWLVDPANPLTARVTVNRYWQLFFGIGLVKTTEDFGVQGEKPTHPELLDWLATEFIGSGGLGLGSGAEPPTPPRVWDVKAMHKLIVMSAAYRQSSKVTPAMVERDPENRLLARGPRFRLASPMIRDQALAVSGLLVEKVGGPPVKGYQPPGIWEEATFGQIRYEQDKGEKLYRRSLYTFWRRIVGPTGMFDAGSRQLCTVRQPRTNTPLHALVTLNDVTFVEAARALAERVLTRGDDTAEARIETAFRLATARKPTVAERNVLTQSLARLRQQYREDKAAAANLLKTGESPRNEKIEVSEHAAWTGLCSLILNLDEALTKE